MNLSRQPELREATDTGFAGKASVTGSLCRPHHVLDRILSIGNQTSEKRVSLVMVSTSRAARFGYLLALGVGLAACAAEEAPPNSPFVMTAFTPVVIFSQILNDEAASASQPSAVDGNPRDAVPQGAAPIPGPAPAAIHAAVIGEAGRNFFRRVRDAVLLHPELGAAEQRIRAAQATVDSSQSALRPRLQVGIDSGSYQTNRDAGARNSAFALARQVLFDGGRAFYQIESDEARVRQFGEERVVAANNLAMRAIEAHVNVRDARALELLAETDKKEHEQLLALIEARVAGGVAAESDVLLGRSRVADAESRLTRANARARETEAIYAEIYGVPAQTLGALPMLPPVEEAYARERLKRNTRLASLDANIASLSASINSARAGRLPRISFEVSRRRLDRRYENTGRDEYYGGVVAEYDLYSGGAVEASVRDAVAKLSEARYRRDNLDRELMRAFALAISDRAAGDSSIRAASMAVQANSAALTAMRDQFIIGRRAVRELLDAQRDKTAAEVSLIQALTSRAIADYAISALTDDLLPIIGIDAASLKGTPQSVRRWP